MSRKSYFLSFLFISLFYFYFLTAYVQAGSSPVVSAKSAVVIDLETGQVLYNKNMNTRGFPASLTKILTTIIALEEGDINDLVKVSRRAAYQEGSSIYLQEGEKIKLEDLLYGVMLSSGNDASVAVAEHISGSIDEFAVLMNKKAQEMGTLNSNFQNPNGLPDPDHYTTAYDLGVIMRSAMKNKVFRTIARTKNRTISWSGNDWGRGLRNHNKLLWLYEDITGGKTGFTKAAGRCLAASAERNGREVIAVVLNDPDDWLDVRKLLDFGLDNFKKIRVVEKGAVIYNLNWEKSREGKLEILSGDAVYLLVPVGGKINIRKQVFLKGELSLPIRKGDIIGTLVFSDEYKIISEIKLIAADDLNYNSIFLRFWYWLTEKIKN